jgi:hypothetical protein
LKSANFPPQFNFGVFGIFAISNNFWQISAKFHKTAKTKVEDMGQKNARSLPDDE